MEEGRSSPNWFYNFNQLLSFSKFYGWFEKCYARELSGENCSYSKGEGLACLYSLANDYLVFAY